MPANTLTKTVSTPQHEPTTTHVVSEVVCLAIESSTDDLLVKVVRDVIFCSEGLFAPPGFCPAGRRVTSIDKARVTRMELVLMWLDTWEPASPTD